VSVALAGHTGPWTPDDVEALPDSGDHARLEVFEGGVLVVSPAPGVAHQRASYWLHRALAEAAAQTHIETEVLEAVNIAMPGNKLLVPDVVVVAADAIDQATTRVTGGAVLAVVEVVSPSTAQSSPPCTPRPPSPSTGASNYRTHPASSSPPWPAAATAPAPLSPPELAAASLSRSPSKSTRPR
jgi:hypothetical protein